MSDYIEGMAVACIMYMSNYIEGMAVACLTKSVQTIKKMKDMVSEGISEKEWMDKLIE